MKLSDLKPEAQKMWLIREKNILTTKINLIKELDLPYARESLLKAENSRWTKLGLPFIRSPDYWLRKIKDFEDDLRNGENYLIDIKDKLKKLGIDVDE